MITCIVTGLPCALVKICDISMVYIVVLNDLSPASKDVLDDAAKKITKDEFLAFLCEIEMNEVENNCKEYSAEDFYHLIEDDEEDVLSELGARTHLQRLKLVIYFKRRLLCKPTHYPCIPVIEFLKSYGYREYITLIEENEIDAELFVKASPETLSEIGFAKNHSRTLATVFSSWIQGDPHDSFHEYADTSVVSQFLSENEQLRQYVDKFKDSHVDKTFLCKATSEDLKAFGVDSALDRLRILTGFPRWLEKREPEYTTQCVVAFLMKTRYKEHSQAFDDNNIDGDIIKKATKDELEEMLLDIGIRNKIHRRLLPKTLKDTFS